jgi:integrase
LEITGCYAELKRLKKVVTADDLKNSYCGILPEDHSLLKIVDYHNTYLKDTIEWGALKNYFTTQKYLELFLKKVRRKADMALSELTYSFLIDFEIFLKSIKPKGNLRPCGHNTVLKHIERLRKMINVAVKNEWITRDPFAKFQAKFVKNSRQFLSEEELMQIELKYFEIARLGFARNLFVFSCYTGLGYCDVMSLTERNITKGIDGEYWIGTARKKNHEPVRVPLLPKALEIIRRYENDPRTIITNTVFPILTNQKLNSYLKEIAQVCVIKKNLTFHLARHTFATTITLTNGVPIESVSKMLGHTSIKTTQIYARVVEKKVSEDMMNLRLKLKSSAGSFPDYSK